MFSYDYLTNEKLECSVQWHTETTITVLVEVRPAAAQQQSEEWNPTQVRTQRDRQSLVCIAVEDVSTMIGNKVQSVG